MSEAHYWHCPLLPPASPISCSMSTSSSVRTCWDYFSFYQKTRISTKRQYFYGIIKMFWSSKKQSVFLWRGEIRRNHPCYFRLSIMLINFFKKRLFSDFRISSVPVLHWQVFISHSNHVSTVGWLHLCSISVYLGLKLRSSAYLQVSWEDHIISTYTGQASLNGAESARGGGKCFWIIMQSITILFF